MHRFDEEERERIRQELVETGRDLVRHHGPKKTNIEDITEPSGIAKSTFYRFFDSKSDLYVEIIERESDDLLEEIETVFKEAANPRAALEEIILTLIEFSETNPLMQYREEFLNSISPQKMSEMSRKQAEDYLPVIKELQEEAGSPFADYDPELIMGLMGAAEYLALHKDEFETYRAGYYEEVKSLLVTVLGNGLMAESSMDQ